ncbi:tetratricopeptide repeat protein [Pontixanthobacter sp.]|uniref:tetratricopeptide repeat protein n=1 Tax=Pontixanthobacter sp. TaxID=2792078 RepID=UPI003C7BB03C
MSFAPILVLAAAVFAMAALILRLPRAGWMLFGATLLFGLTGYAMQGAPGYAGSPTPPRAEISQSNFAMIDARRDFFGRTTVPSRYVTISDGFARQGQFKDAADFLNNALEENAQDAEAWVALGNAISEHADGALTPASLYAYAQADSAAPGNPAASYFLGVGLIRSGRPGDARGVWADILAKAPPDAEWREQLAGRLARLDEVLAQISPVDPAAPAGQ